MATASSLMEFGGSWEGVCFLCQSPQGPFRLDQRVCSKCWKMCVGAERATLFKEIREPAEYFVTILPAHELPSLDSIINGNFDDLFLPEVRKGRRGHPFPTRGNNPEGLRHFGLPCGQPILVNVTSLASQTGFKRVEILDLSRYIWSGTLKDLRSWAIMSLAIENRVSQLALWTAGNAGYSLARMVYRWNSSCPESKRIKLYAIVSTEMSYNDPEIVVVLRSLGAHVIPIANEGGLVLPGRKVEGIIRSLAPDDTTFWHVTDGWDGIGVFLYRQLARQVIKMSSPDIILVPVGTGDMFIGFHQGNQDLGWGSKLIGALPYGDNVVDSLYHDTLDEGLGEGPIEGRPPIAPKLSGFYSPLAPCLWYLDPGDKGDMGNRQQVEYVRVDRADQIEAGARLLGGQQGPSMAAEPSALIAFGALGRVRELLRRDEIDPGEMDILVINSGFGLMSKREYDLFSRSIFQFR